MILVTGGTGFLGSELVKQLRKKGEKVRILSRSHPAGERDFIAGDITDSTSLEMAMKGVDVVYHLAALVDHFAPEEELEKINAQGTRNVIAAAVKNKVRLFIHCSSVSAEKGGGTSAYGRSKIHAEKEIMKYKKRIKIIIIRPGPIYDAERKMLRNIMIIPRYLHIFGILWPDTTIHLASRKNVTNAFLLALRKGVGGHAYAICDAHPVKRSLLSRIICKRAKAIPIPIAYPICYPFLYAAALVSEALGKAGARLPITRQYLKVMTRERSYDIYVARKELGYDPETTEHDFAEAVDSCMK